MRPETTSSPGRNFEKLTKTADLANSTASEDDKIKAMMLMSSQEYDPSKYVKSRSMTGPLPPNYTCFRCGKSGHWIKNCPTNNIEVKRSTGIPRSFMVTVDGPDHKGALLTSTGEFAVPLIDHEAYKEVKKEKPPFVREPTPEPVQEPQLPDELLCMICHDLLQDAVLIPCCGNSFCDDCVRQALLDSEQHECPVCHETDISPNNLIPNRFLRTAVLNFKNETGYTRVRRGQVPSSTTPVPSAAATLSPRVEGTAEGSATPPVARPEEQEAEKRSPAKGVPVSSGTGDVVDAASSLDAVTASLGSDDASSSPAAVGTPGENPPGTPLADEHPDEPAAPSLDEALTMSPQHHSHDENSPSRGPHPSGSPASFGNGEESVCTISTITTRVPSYAGPIAIPGRSNHDPPLDTSRGPPGRGSLHRSSRHGDYGHHRSRHDYGPGGSLRSTGDYRSGGYPPYSSSGGGLGGGGPGGSYPPPPLHIPPPPQGHHLAPPNLPPPPFPGQAPPPGLAGMTVVPPHFSMHSGAGYMPVAKPFGSTDDYHGRRSRSRRAGDPLEEFEKHLRDLHRNRHHRERRGERRGRSHSKTRSSRSRSSSYSRSRSKSRGGRSATSRSYSPRSRYSGSSRSYSPRSRSYSPRSRSRSYSRSRSRSPVRHRRSRSPRSPGGGGEGRRRAGSKSPHGRRSRSGSYRSRSRSPSRLSRRGRHHYHSSSHGSSRPYRRSRTPRSPRSYHHHPLPPPPPHHIGQPPHGYRSRSPAFRAHRRGFYGGPPGGYPHHHPGYPHHPSEHMVPPMEFDSRSGHYFPPHHHPRDGINPAFRGYPTGYPSDSLPPPPHRGESRGNSRFDSGGLPGMPSRGYHGDPGSRRERSRSDYPPPPEALTESSSKGSRESRSREHRRHPEQITTPLVVSRDGGDGKEGSTRLDSEGAIKGRKRSKEKEEKLLRHKHHHRSKESRKEAREAPLQEGAVKTPKASSTAAPPEGNQLAIEVTAEGSPVSSKETVKGTRELVKVEGDGPLSSEGAAVKERKHKHKKKLKQEEMLKKMSAKLASRTSDESSQQPPGADDEPLKRKKKKKKPREARLLTKSMLLTPPDLSREQSMVAFLTAELEQGVPDAARLSKIEEQLELAKKKLLGEEIEGAKAETNMPEVSGEVAAAQGCVDDIWDKAELEVESKEQSAAGKEEENVLQVEVPELSKWEREELEGEESPLPPSEPVEEAKEAKPLVSSEVLQRAENVLLHKPRKKAMVAAANAATTAVLSRLSTSEPKKLPSKVASPDDVQPTPTEESPSQPSIREVKESWKDPSVPLRLRDRLDGTLQVTITSSSEKERRSVTTADKEQHGSSSEGTQPTKRVKLDRSKFGEKHSRAESSEASNSTRLPKSSSSGSSRRNDRSRSDDRAPPDREWRLLPEDVRSRLEDRRALEAGGHSRVLSLSAGGSSRSDRELARSSRSGRARDKEVLHRSSSRDGHSDERRRYKDERYYAVLHEERVRRAYEEARHKQMEGELAHGSRRKAQEEYRSRHAAEDSEHVRSRERRMDALHLQGKSDDHGDDENHHRSRRADWSAEQAASLPSSGPQAAQRSRSKEKVDKSPHRQHHHREKTLQFAPPPAVALAAASDGGGTSVGGQENEGMSLTTAAMPLEKKASPVLTAAEEAPRHRKESTQDESRFEPDYDEMIEEEPGCGGTVDATVISGRVASTKRKAVAVTNVPAVKGLQVAEEELALPSAKPSTSPATSATLAVAAQSAGTSAALAPVISTDDRSSSSSSDSSDEEVTSHKKHKKRHKKHKKHKHKHKRKKKSKKADKSD